MCGIAGFIDNSLLSSKTRLQNIADDMSLAINYRGPDENGVWVCEANGVALAHRRLAVVDLSPAGSQPMVSSCGRFIMVYNGEIYNTEELRRKLTKEGIYTYRGHSDTEVILEGFATWGIRQTVERLNGMFAIGVWDKKLKQLTLIRDRLGIKPLYWSNLNGKFLFGSELKSLCAHPCFKVTKDKNAIAAFVRHNYIPGPHTVYKEVSKLQAGTILTVDQKFLNEPNIEKYWTMAKVVKSTRLNQFQGSDEEAVTELESLLSDAVERQMISDVPLGAFLSGGIDSSTIVALMQKKSMRPVKTFSIGFEVEGYNEAPYAAAVAKHLGTEHTELIVTEADALNVIPKLVTMYDEPFADSSQIPTFLVAELARKDVTVALSGDGGDELFAGYERYFRTHTLSGTLNKFPLWMRKCSSNVIHSLSPALWDSLFQIVPKSVRPKYVGNKIHKLGELIRKDEDDVYRYLMSHWKDTESIVIDSKEHRGIFFDKTIKDFLPNLTDRMRYIDSCTYLPDDILTKVDRASMAVSLETRVPLLDHRVVEFAWTLPESLLIKDGVGKWPLRQVLSNYVPDNLIDRPKMGFGIPIGAWLRSSLNEWAEELLNPTSINRYGILNSDMVWKKWKEHLSGEQNWDYYLWDILMLQSWCKHNEKT